MHLSEKPLNWILEGKKKVEVRLNDEKRKKLEVGDRVIFYPLKNEEGGVMVKVTDLSEYGSFRELFINVDESKLGNKGSLNEKVNSMRDYYSKGEEKRKGVLAIYFKVIGKLVSDF